eukprot:scaffold71762_cov37-Prasinocladus_malaysianus.AAC.2
MIATGVRGGLKPAFRPRHGSALLLTQRDALLTRPITVNRLDGRIFRPPTWRIAFPSQSALADAMRYTWSERGWSGMAARILCGSQLDVQPDAYTNTVRKRTSEASG